MPNLRSYSALSIAKGIKVFLGLDVGVTGAGSSRQPVEELEEARQRLAAKDRKIARLLKELREGSISLGNEANPEAFVWVFGTARTGSTWLSKMMGDLSGYTVWDEPLVGKLFGDLYNTQAGEGRRDDKHFILGGSDERRAHVREFVLNGAATRFPEVGSDHLVIKEPNGSVGAPLLMEALPESRMILMVRDPRDSVASFLEAHKKGGWLYEQKDEKVKASLEKTPEADFTRRRSRDVLRDVSNAKTAYDAHKGYKALVRYEDLIADSLGSMKRVYSDLNLPYREAELEAAVKKYSWGNLSEEKGAGKFYRKATPGGWREDLSSEQVKIVEQVTRPLLKQFYPEG